MVPELDHGLGGVALFVGGRADALEHFGDVPKIESVVRFGGSG